MILDLLASTIDYMRHFIGNNEFQVLIQTIYPARGVQIHFGQICRDLKTLASTITGKVTIHATKVVGYIPETMLLEENSQ